MRLGILYLCMIFGCLSCMCCTQVELVKPLGIKFARGSDGGAYVTRSDPNMGNTDKMVQVHGTERKSCSPLTSNNEKHFAAVNKCQSDISPLHKMMHSRLCTQDESRETCCLWHIAPHCYLHIQRLPLKIAMRLRCAARGQNPQSQCIIWQ